MKQRVQLVTRAATLALLAAVMHICTTGQLLAGGGENGTESARVFILINEDFSTAEGTTPPAGWRNYARTGPAIDGWRFDNSEAPSLPGTLLRPVAFVEQSGTQFREALLESVPFDARTSYSLMLTFDHVFIATDTNVSASVEVFDGYTWHELVRYSASVPAATHQSYDITSLAGCAPQAAVRFRWSARMPGSWAVDNVLVAKRVLVAAPAPIAAAAPADGATGVHPGASLGWTPAPPCPSGYKLYFGTDNPPTNILNGVDVGSTSSYVPPSGLSPNTSYFWRVVPYNAFGEAAGTAVRTFTTGDNLTINAFPYTQNFDVNTYGWSSENANGDPYTWELTTENPRSAPTAVVAKPNPNGATAANDWLFTPPLQLAAGHVYNVEFWTRNVSTLYTEALQLYFGSDQISVTMQPVPFLRNIALNNTEYQKLEGTFTAPNTEGTAEAVVGWNYFSTAGTFGLLLDDVTISDLGPAPVLYGPMTAASPGPGSVVISWRAVSQVNNVRFEIQKATAPSIDFQTIPGSIVDGHGTTSVPHDYSWIDTAPGTTTTYYRIKQTSVNGDVHYSNAIAMDGVTSVSEAGTAPHEFTLDQNYPNPFNPETRIQFSVPAAGQTSLQVFNTLGQLVVTLFEGIAEPGRIYTQTFNAAGLTSGVYFYRLQNNGQSSTRKLVLMK